MIWGYHYFRKHPYKQKPHTLRSPRNYIWSSISLYIWSNSCIFHKCSCRKGFAIPGKWRNPHGSKILIKHLGAAGFNMSQYLTSKNCLENPSFPRKVALEKPLFSFKGTMTLESITKHPKTALKMRRIVVCFADKKSLQNTKPANLGEILDVHKVQWVWKL